MYIKLIYSVAALVLLIVVTILLITIIHMVILTIILTHIPITIRQITIIQLIIMIMMVEDRGGSLRRGLASRNRSKPFIILVSIICLLPREDRGDCGGTPRRGLAWRDQTLSSVV